MLLAHATLGLAYAAVLVQARLATLDRSLEEAAADLGAGPFTVFRTVTLPLIAPALAAGWLLAFTLSLDDVVLASFVSGPAGTTLPMLVFSALRVGVTPEVNALGTAVLAVVALARAWLVGDPRAARRGAGAGGRSGGPASWLGRKRRSAPGWNRTRRRESVAAAPAVRLEPPRP